MKHLTISLILAALMCGGCQSAVDRAVFTPTETALQNADGTPQTDAAGNQVYETTYAPSVVAAGAVKTVEALPAPISYIGYGIGALLAGICEWRRRKYIKLADGTISELETENGKLQKALAALTAATVALAA